MRKRRRLKWKEERKKNDRWNEKRKKEEMRFGMEEGTTEKGREEDQKKEILK